MANEHDKKDPMDLLDGLYGFAFECEEDSFSMPIEEVEEELRLQGIDPGGIDQRARDAFARLLGYEDCALATAAVDAAEDRAGHKATPACAAAAHVGMTPAAFFKRLSEVGLTKEFVRERLLPTALLFRLDALKVKSGDEARAVAVEVAETVGRVFNWTAAELFSGEPLSMPAGAYGAARFKLPASASERKATIYAAYAHRLAMLVLEATVDLPTHAIPTDAELVRTKLEKRYGAVTFASTLHFAWDLGIPVLPLADPGAFHGACWRARGRNVIVLKQQTLSPARWLTDLLHEIGHGGQEPEKTERAVIEENETADARRTSAEEKIVSRFAGDVLLGGRADTLAKMCVKEADNRMERLKMAVQRVAAREKVPVDVLANYLAFRLSLEKKTWWGAATNLQDFTSNPYEVTRDVLLERVNLDRLEPPDRELLQRALGVE